jgi:hypothetical protein
MTEAILALRGEIVNYLYEAIAYSKKSRLGGSTSKYENV